ncbi:MAG: hypothetical protein JO331_14110 [Verrucomicrobia bacterium]|nr:hypothetical protein [Verrucomicrobiota bacterium]
MPEHIAELPTGPVEGGGGRVHPPHPGVVELPVGPVYYAFDREAVTELFRLRDRVHALESELLIIKFNPRSPRPNPHELPQHPDFILQRPGPGAPNELPPVEVGELTQYISAILARLTSIEASIAALQASTGAQG